MRFLRAAALAFGSILLAATFAVSVLLALAAGGALPILLP